MAVALALKEFKKQKNMLSVPSPSPNIEQKIKEKFNGLAIPTDSQKMELKDVFGGESFGIVTDTEILAYLPEPSVNEIYKAWLVLNGKRTLIGNLEQGKGGWIVDFDFSKHLNYEKIVITGDSGDILEGSF